MSDFDNAADWTGQQVGGADGDASRFGQDVRNDFDRGVQHVENAPDDAARWTGDKVGDAARDVRDAGRDVVSGVRDVDRFGRGVDDSFDQGKWQGEQQGGW